MVFFNSFSDSAIKSTLFTLIPFLCKYSTSCVGVVLSFVSKTKSSASYEILSAPYSTRALNAFSSSLVFIRNERVFLATWVISIFFLWRAIKICFSNASCSTSSSIWSFCLFIRTAWAICAISLVWAKLGSRPFPSLGKRGINFHESFYNFFIIILI